MLITATIAYKTSLAIKNAQATRVTLNVCNNSCKIIKTKHPFNFISA